MGPEAYCVNRRFDVSGPLPFRMDRHYFAHALAGVIALTEEGLGGDPVCEKIVRAVGRSPRTLARRFSEGMGMTWREALRRLRIVRAMELLAMSDVSVTEVSLSVGYASLSGFNAAFRELTGMAPGSYRKSLSG